MLRPLSNHWTLRRLYNDDDGDYDGGDDDDEQNRCVRIQIDISSNIRDNRGSGSVSLGLAGLEGATQSMIEYNLSFTKIQ